MPEEDPAFGQASAAAGVFLEETGAFAAGEFRAVNVFDIGGERSPKINDSLDFLAFRHEPHYVVVEVAALEPTRTEPGRAPAPAVIDETRQRQYVYMIRDLGARRQPATVLVHRGRHRLPDAVLAAAPPRARPVTTSPTAARCPSRVTVRAQRVATM